MTKLIKALYFVIYLVAGVYSLSGCVERFDADISSDDANVLVVEGAICSGELNKFVLSRSQTINSVLTPRTVKGAKVSVHGSDGSEYVAQEADGYYACQIDGLSPDVAYCLHIEVDGEVYESEPQKPLRTEKIADVMGMQNTPESNIDVLVTPAEPFEPDQVHYYSWTYDETWEVHPDYTTVIYYDTNTKAPVYDPHQFPERGWTNATGSTIIVGSSQNYEGQHIRRFKMYDIDRGDKRMYHRYSGLVHQRAISKAEYEYELARRQASLEMGGLFTPLPSALPTNIHCLTSKKHVKDRIKKNNIKIKKEGFRERLFQKLNTMAKTEIMPILEKNDDILNLGGAYIDEEYSDNDSFNIKTDFHKKLSPFCENDDKKEKDEENKGEKDINLNDSRSSNSSNDTKVYKLNGPIKNFIKNQIKDDDINNVNDFEKNDINSKEVVVKSNSLKNQNNLNFIIDEQIEEENNSINEIQKDKKEENKILSQENKIDSININDNVTTNNTNSNQNSKLGSVGFNNESNIKESKTKDNVTTPGLIIVNKNINEINEEKRVSADIKKVENRFGQIMGPENELNQKYSGKVVKNKDKDCNIF